MLQLRERACHHIERHQKHGLHHFSIDTMTVPAATSWLPTPLIPDANVIRRRGTECRFYRNTLDARGEAQRSVAGRSAKNNQAAEGGWGGWAGRGTEGTAVQQQRSENTTTRARPSSSEAQNTAADILRIDDTWYWFASDGCRMSLYRHSISFWVLTVTPFDGRHGGHLCAAPPGRPTACCRLQATTSARPVLGHLVDTVPEQGRERGCLSYSRNARSPSLPSPPRELFKNQRLRAWRRAWMIGLRNCVRRMRPWRRRSLDSPSAATAG